MAAARKAPSRTHTHARTPRVNPFDTDGPSSRLASRRQQSQRPFQPPLPDPVEAALYSSRPVIGPGTSSRVTAAAVEQATARMNATAQGQRQGQEQRAQAMRREFLPPGIVGLPEVAPFSLDDPPTMDDDAMADAIEDDAQTRYETQRVNPPARPTPAPPPTRPMPPSPLGRRAPAPAPAPAKSPAPALSFRAIDPYDIDRLWDWIRLDGDYGTLFLGREFTSSLSLHTFIQSLIEAESQGVALVRALAYGDDHLGFVMLSPLLAADRLAVLHMYLREDLRARGAEMVPLLVDLAARLAPDFRLAIASPNEEWAAFQRTVLLPLGFVEHTMFVR